MPSSPVVNSSFSKAARGAALMRISSCALPPVSAKPKPSMVWKCCASFTESTDSSPASEEKCSELGCGATTLVRSGVVSHSRASCSCRAFDEKGANSKVQDKKRTTLSFMRTPTSEGRYVSWKQTMALVRSDNCATISPTIRAGHTRACQPRPAATTAFALLEELRLFPVSNKKSIDKVELCWIANFEREVYEANQGE